MKAYLPTYLHKYVLIIFTVMDYNDGNEQVDYYVAIKMLLFRMIMITVIIIIIIIFIYNKVKVCAMFYLCHEYWHEEIVNEQSLWDICKIEAKEQQSKDEDQMLTRRVRECTTKQFETNNTYDDRADSETQTQI